MIRKGEPQGSPFHFVGWARGMKPSFKIHNTNGIFEIYGGSC